MSAIDAGVDTSISISPFANGTGQPDTTRMLAMLKDHPRCPAISEAQQKSLKDIRIHLEKAYDALSAFTSHKNEVIDVDTLEYQVPGGMLSNFRTQLKEQKMEDQFEAVFREIPVVREALGWIPLVTPTSQIVGMQAFLNVKFGRWKQISPQAADIALGYYGRCPASRPTGTSAGSKQTERDPISCRPVESPQAKHKHMDELKKELDAKRIPERPEHCVIHAMFPQQLEAHIKGSNKLKPVVKPAATPKAEAISSTAATGPQKKYALTINGKRIEVGVEELV